jgi:diguanylate cyclase (GGDEF)-like protein
MRLPIGVGDELLVAPKRDLADEEINFVRALANTLATALERLWGLERVQHQAVHDPLTGLANRTLLRDRLKHALARATRGGGATGVLFVDLDGFKQINDAYGHAVGDAVLAEIGARLPQAVRPGDTVARLGGDEFVVVCEGVDHDSALAVAVRLQEMIRLPLTHAGVRHDVDASVGIALGHADSDALVARADTAVYRAKAAGGGRVEFFE